MARDPCRIEDLETLEALYGPVPARALTKEVDRLTPHYRAFVEAAPFVALATAGPEGLDCSPRGDPAGFVAAQDDRTLLMPDRPGNNRLDSLRNVLRDPRVALLFLIPGLGETLRVNGRAELRTDPELLARFEMRGRLPRTVLRIAVERAYYQCPKALVRSRLWDPASRPPRDRVPSAGAIQAALAPGEVDAEAYDCAYPERMARTIY
jgi:PPOX class probable FMN-dependent enzyme